MRKINVMMARLQVKASRALENFKNSERGDTNFISMLLIIGIVVVLAAAFLKLGKGVMDTISQKVTEFLRTLN